MTYRWPVLDGWGQETIPFPLPFAPGLPHHGIEELRFMPGWARLGEPGHWSYVFAWWLEPATNLDEASLIADLTGYYAGLCAAVGGAAASFDSDGYRVRLHPVAGELRNGHKVRRLDGTADLFDAFAGGEALTLNLRLATWKCPVAGRVIVLIDACPTRDRAVWEHLLAQDREFACH